MDPQLIPVKTAQGHDELGTRQRRLGPRHRTMLLLADGERTVNEVLNLSFRAGVPPSCFRELLSLGLLVVPDEQPLRCKVAQGQLPEEIPRSAAPAAVCPSEGGSDTDCYVSTVACDSGLDGQHEKAPTRSLEDARDLLLQVVGTEARLTGALTMMRIKRARTPIELLALLGEVETRINRPDRAIATRQLMDRVAQLLSLAENRPQAQASV